MKRKLTIESSEEGRIEICYDSLPMKEIESRILAYKRKHGMTFSRFLRNFSCDSAGPDEMTDYMDWKYLLKERSDRVRVATRKKR